jgi:hypothetical protein
LCFNQKTLNRIELHDLNQDYRGSSASVPKKHRVFRRPETKEDILIGQGFWNKHFGATVYEEDEEEREGEGGEEEEEENGGEPIEELDLAKELNN